MFLQDVPYDGPIPVHLDALLGLPCQGSGRRPPSVLELSGSEGQEHALDWPAFYG